MSNTMSNPNDVRPDRFSHPLYPVFLIIGIAALLLWTLRHGLIWDGDPELYIMNARNIVLGHPYGISEYLFNPANAIHPSAYPPGFPLFLAPIYAVFGIDTFKMKMECVLAFALFLAVFFRIARNYLSPGAALAVTAALGLHPAIVNFVDVFLLSEFPFMLFAYAALYMLYRIQGERPIAGPSGVAMICACGVAIACAYLTRAIGALLFPAALVACAYRPRRAFIATTMALATAAIPIAVIQTVFPGNVGTYIHYFSDFSLHSVLNGVRRYAGVSAWLFGNLSVTFPALRAVLGAAFLWLCIAGFRDRVRRFSVFEAFLLIYVAFLLVYPIAQEPERYSMPIFPLAFLYFANGIAVSGRDFSVRRRQVLTYAVCTVVVVLYSTQFATMQFQFGGAVPYSVDAPASRELYSAIRDKLPREARILTRKPTIIGLYTGHTATIWPDPFTDDELRSYMRKFNVEYIVREIPPIAGAPADDPLDAFIHRNQAELKIIFKNEWFRLYRAEDAAP